VLQLLGRGAFGTVYKAHDPQLDVNVALKVPRAGYFGSREEEERFLREARSAARLKHPNIVQVHDVASDRGVPFIVSGFVDGATLSDTIATGLPDYRETAELVAQMADALDYAHGEGVIHRDIKPANILIDADGRPHITDFGLAHRDEGEVTVTLDGQILGTPAYMSPKQAAGEHQNVDARTDVYSLGVVLYELLTGELPFRGNHRMLLHQVLNDDPRPPRSLEDSTPRDLETICLKAMAKEPDRRFQTARDMADDLRRWLNDEPIRARRVGNLERFSRLCQRNPVVVCLTILIVIVFFWGTALSSYFATANSPDEARRKLDQVTHESRERLSRLYVANGLRLMDGGDYRGAAVWFAEALGQDAGNPSRERMQRIRLRTVLAQCPWLVQIFGHESDVFDAQFSPDGRTVLTVCGDNAVRVWSVDSGKLVAPKLGHSGKLKQASFSPDGRRVVTAVGDEDKPGEVWIWDVATGRPVTEPIKHTLPVNDVSFSPDGLRVLAASGTASKPGEARIWNASSGQSVTPPLEHQKGNVNRASFSHDGRLVVTAGGDGDARVWDVTTGRNLAEFTIEGGVSHASFSRDGRRVLTAGHKRARVWDVEKRIAVTPLLECKSEIVLAEFSPNARHVITIADKVLVWDAANGELNHEDAVSLVAPESGGAFLLRGNFGGVNAAQVSPDGRWVAMAALGKLVVRPTPSMFEFLQPSPTTVTLPLDHGDSVRSVAFSPDGRWVVTANEDRIVRVWDVTRTGVATTILKRADADGGYARYARFSSDGGRVAIRSGDEGRVWDTATGDPVSPPVTGCGDVRQASFSADATRVLTLHKSEAQIWDAVQGKTIGPRLGHGKNMTAATFSPDGRRVATASDDTVRIWNAASGKPITPSLTHDGPVNHVSFSPDGARLLAACANGEARLWDVSSGNLRASTAKHGKSPSVAAFSPDGMYIGTASEDGTARIWNAATGKPVTPFLKRDAPVWHVEFSPDGRRVLTSSAYASLVWDAASGKTLTPPMRMRLPIHARAAFSRDGRLIAQWMYVPFWGSTNILETQAFDAASGEPVTPPLFEGGCRSEHVSLSPDGQRLRTGLEDGTMQVWDLRPDDRPVDYLLRYTSLLANRRMDEAGGLVPVESSSIPAEFAALKSQRPDDFASSPDQILSWHRAQVVACESAEHWYGVVFHINHLLSANANEAWLAERRNRAAEKLAAESK
jgi:WD40 repeat protein/serine/threonine protein kinase